MRKSVALLGEYIPAFPPHVSTDAAIEHVRNFLEINITAEWVSTEDINDDLFARYSGIWVAPGSPHRHQLKEI